LKVCVLSEYACSLLSGTGKEIGGAELQMIMLARALLERSHDVSFVSFGDSQYFTQVDGLKVYNPFDIRNSGFTYMKPWNILSLFRTLKKIDADIYIQRGVSPLTGLAAIFCRLNHKKFVYAVASDSAVSSYLNIENVSDLKKVFYKIGIKLSSEVVCQSEVQREFLDKIGKRSVLIKNAYISPSLKPENEHEAKSLWVGRIAMEKRPDIYLKLAEEIPDHDFFMVGAPSTKDRSYYQSIKNEAKKMDNVRFLGFVPHEQINEYYCRSSMLVNTSPAEGFPNTFLEAWGNSIPVVSFVDPDGVISSNKLGYHSRNFNEMVENVRKLFETEHLRVEMGNNGRKYVLKEHNFKKVVDTYEKLFERLVSTKA
jgi:glycosyltransferase involved in cell wall biosynthesis